MRKRVAERGGAPIQLQRRPHLAPAAAPHPAPEPNPHPPTHPAPTPAANNKK
jgi:hypothetical protein